ncbi:acyl-ACP thioesterase domain-containing protein [Ferrimicrobium sp.]|uniref:acyl-ACP thioesterase domain-containing protein n=1 Tax=Ferrimicrobium sp. TaxID=2926050 RepID=UPI0026301D27|nr:acyl-ACP thioesterase domain-containing protein [Ferrimicrobium sp.]
MDFTPEPQQGRIFSNEHCNLLSDCDPTGRLRLDGIARILHDTATLDNESAPAPDKGLWILRNLSTQLRVWPGYLDSITTRTWCSGIGRAWAERRTDLYRQNQLVAQAKALWVNVAPDTGFPRSLPDGFLSVFGPSAMGRTLKPRFELSLPTDEPMNTGNVPLRYSDLDIIDHVNNAVHLAIVEEVFAPTHRGTASLLTHYDSFAIEFHNGLQLPEHADWALWKSGNSATLRLSQASAIASVVLLQKEIESTMASDNDQVES